MLWVFITKYNFFYLTFTYFILNQNIISLSKTIIIIIFFFISCVIWFIRRKFNERFEFSFKTPRSSDLKTNFVNFDVFILFTTHILFKVLLSNVHLNVLHQHGNSCSNRNRFNSWNIYSYAILRVRSHKLKTFTVAYDLCVQFFFLHTIIC